MTNSLWCFLRAFSKNSESNFYGFANGVIKAIIITVLSIATALAPFNAKGLADLSTNKALPSVIHKSPISNVIKKGIGINMARVIASSDATLSNLTLNSGTLTPPFEAGITYYTVYVPNITTGITVTPTVTDPNATVSVNGTTIPSGNASANILLNIGDNTITVLVTAQDGVTTNRYTIMVTRGDFPTPTNPASNIAFSSLTSNSTTVSWTNGIGTARAVFVLASTDGGPASPANNTTYIANPNFGAGSQTVYGWYCVYNGTGSSVNIIGLTGGVTYQVVVLEYNGTPGYEKYIPFGTAHAVTTLSSGLPVRYVTTTGAGTMDGSSWANASNNLQAMIDASAPTNQVWVAGGTYKPSAYPTGSTGGTTSRDYAFSLKPDVMVYGGFAGNEISLGTRISGSNISILSGDIGNIGDKTDNCYHVLISSGGVGAAIIDGFTISDGYSELTNTTSSITVNGNPIIRSLGAAIYLNSSTPALANLKIINNYSLAGPVSLFNSSAGIGSCLFNNNGAGAGSGGALYADVNSKPTITSCVFTGNQTSNMGGACELMGGATISGSTFINDKSQVNGGALDIEGGTGSSITNCVFAGNATGNFGGALRVTASTVTVTNCTFYDNFVYANGPNGGAVRSFGTATLNLVNNIFNKNAYNGEMSVVNQPGSDISNAATVNVYYSLTQTVQSGTGNNTGNPAFVNAANIAGVDGIYGTADDGLNLTGVSDAQDTGTATNAPSKDIAGTPRPQGTGFDMGAYETAVPHSAGPTTQATNVIFSNVTNVSAAINWQNGNGTARAVFISNSTTGSPLPVDANSYTPNSNYGDGAQIGASGWYCIYNGTGNSANVYNLNTGVNYRVMVVEYNGNPGSEKYLTTTATGNPANTGTQVFVSSITRNSPNHTNAATVSYTVTFQGNISGLSASNFSLNTTGTIGGANVNNITGSGSTYTVFVNTGVGDGSITLVLANTTGITPGIGGTIPFSGPSYDIQKSAPSIIGGNYSSNNTVSNTKAKIGDVITLNFTTSEPVQQPTLLIAGHNVPVTNQNPDGTSWTGNYTMTGSDAEGAVNFSLSFTNLIGMQANGGNPYNASDAGTTIIFDKTSPTISSINIQNPATSVTLATSLVYRVTFSEAVSNVGASAFQVSTTGATSGTVASVSPVSSTVFDVTVNSVSGIGSIRLDLIAPPSGIMDQAGNMPVSAFTGGQVYYIGTYGAPIVVTGNASNITATGATLNGTVNDNGDDAAVSFVYGTVPDLNSGTTTTAATTGATVSKGSGNTPVALTLNALSTSTTYYYRVSATNAGGTTLGPILNVTPSANSISLNSIQLVSVSPTNAALVYYTITFGAPVSGLTASNFSLTTKGLSGASIAAVSGIGATWNVAVNTGTGDGTIQLNFVNAGGLTSGINNSLPYAGPVCTIDKTAPQATGGDFSSNNTFDNSYAKVGDVITLSFVVSEPIQTPTISIAGHSVTATNPGNDQINWSANYTMTTEDIEGLVDFSVTFNDLAGNAENGGMPITAANTKSALTFDKTSPTVLSINTQNPAKPYTAPTQLTYRVTFSEPVTNVGPGAFQLFTTGTANGSLFHTMSGPSANIVDVTVNNVSGIGTIRMIMKSPPNGIRDQAGNLVQAGFTSGQIFTIIALPSVTTGPASVISATGATLSGTVNDNGDATMANFIYGTSPDLIGGTTVQATTNGNISAGAGSTPVAISLSGLNPSTTYYYRVSATNSAGTNNAGVFNFSTPSQKPSATTFLASSITSHGATLNGNANDNGTATSVSFIYGLTSDLINGSITVPATTGGSLSVGAGNTNAAVTLTGLKSNTNYFYRISATNSFGTTLGAVIVQFTTPISTDASLAGLSTSTGTLSPTFNPGTFAYTVNVPNSVTTINATPIVNDPAAIVNINGAMVVSGTPSTDKSLDVGSNKITVNVTAQDGTTTNTYTITVIRAAIAPPTLQATNIKFSNISNTGLSLSWTNGNGTSRVVFIAPKTSIPPLPLDSTTYMPGATAAQGATIGSSGWFCVYNGSGSSASVTGLKAATAYRFMVLEYNGTTGTQRYLTSLSTGNPLKITTAYAKPTVQAINIIFTNTTSSGTTVNWTNGNGTSRVVFIAPKTSIPPLPLDSTTYTPGATAPQGSTIGSSGWFCVYNGTGSSAPVTGLKAGTAYRFMVLEYNGNTGTQRYLTSQSTNNPLKTTTLTVNPIGINNGVNNLALVSPLSGTDIKVEAANILSPNGDGKNDTWIVKNIDQYPTNQVTISDQAGNTVFTQKGYTNNWGGSYRGSIVAEGTYYYLIDLGNGSTLKGFITVVRD